MGFYVDLEMPEDCPMCPFAYYDMFNTFRGCDITRGKRWAVKNDKDYAESSTRPDWCPLIEVPEPHGRLIDKDALDIYQRAEAAYAEYQEDEDNLYLEGMANGLCEAAKQLSTARTVIHASKEG